MAEILELYNYKLLSLLLLSYKTLCSKSGPLSAIENWTGSASKRTNAVMQLTRGTCDGKKEKRGRPKGAG